MSADRTTRTIELGDVRLNVLDVGTGPTLLLVHGFPLDHAMWQGQIAHFASRMRVVAPDLRGFGASTLAAGAEATSMETFADDLAQLLDALAIIEPVTFCGLSMGGCIAWQFALRYRQRLARLVLCDTRAAPDSPAVAEGRFKTAEQVLAVGTESLCQAMLPRLLAKANREHATAARTYIGQAIRAAPPAGVAAAARGMARRIDATSLLPTLDVPALLVVGEEDVISPVDEMRGMAQAMPKAELAVIAGAGHMAPLEQPAIVNRSLEAFLGC